MESELYRATDSVILNYSDDVLNKKCINYLNYDRNCFNDVTCTVDDSLVKLTLNHTTRNHEGRLVMPLMWNNRTCKFLGSNFALSKQILKSILKKHSNNISKLGKIDDVFKDQMASGVIEEIEDLSGFISNNPEASFLDHMPVFKLNHES